MLTVLLSAILSVPALLVLVATVPIVAVLSLPAAFLLCHRKRKGHEPRSSDDGSRSDDDDDATHVIVTGGSSGIGLAIAREAARTPCVRKITVIARNQERLNAARDSILGERDATGDANSNNLQVHALSIDVTDPEALKEAASAKVFDHQQKNKKLTTMRTLLFCCAGEPLPAYFEDVPSSMYAHLAAVNQLGCIYAVQAFLPYVKRGTVSLCSSAAGLVGVFGYTAYSPTKFALRGFAECLHAELGDRPIHVQVAYPPDTSTPGFEKENLIKPEETRLVSEAGGLAQPEDVGRIMLRSAMRPSPPFAVYFDFDGFVLSTLTAGFSPVSTWLDAVAQLCGLVTIFRWVSLFYLQVWSAMIRRCRSERNSSSKTTTTKGTTAATASDASKQD